jgi:glycosyl transferase, family 25
MRAYVINLARSVDRRMHITTELRKTDLDYEIMTAVDGRDLDLHDSAVIDSSMINRNALPAGTAGCALSHLRAYQKIVEDGLNEALILEDDVRLPVDLASLADAVADQLTGAEVALLSYESRDTCKISSVGSVDLPSARMLAFPIDISQLIGAAAYVITREACKRMSESMPPVRANADDWRFFYKEGTLDRVRCVLPLPVVKNPKLESTIGSYSLGSGVKARLFAPFVRYKIPLLHQAIIYRRSRIYREWNRSEIVDVPFVDKPSRLG